MSEILTVATANTYESRMLKHPDGIVPFVENKVDVLLMQEVLGMKPEEVDDRLSEDGYELAACQPTLGLAIATRSDSRLGLKVKESDTTHIHQTSILEKTLKSLNQNSHRLRQRGLIGVKLQTESDKSFTAISTHPIVFIRALSRQRQVRAIGQALNDPFYDSPRLILGGDMNHYPNPRKVDQEMTRLAGLDRVKLLEPTWCIEGSKHEWMARLGSLVTRRTIDRFDAELDTIQFRGLNLISADVIEIESDHKAIISKFKI